VRRSGVEPASVGCRPTVGSALESPLNYRRKPVVEGAGVEPA